VITRVVQSGVSASVARKLAIAVLCCLGMSPLLSAGIRTGVFLQQTPSSHGTAQGLPSNDVLELAFVERRIHARTVRGAARLEGSRWHAAPYPAPIRHDSTGLERAAGGPVEIRQVASRTGLTAVATNRGLYLRRENGGWEALAPREGRRAWALSDVRGVAFDTAGRLWFAAHQGVGCLEATGWKLYTGLDGLPYNDFTTMGAAADGSVWFGTRRGAIRFDGKVWEYRQGRRWLPHDEVRSIAFDQQGTAYFATPQGIGVIAFQPITLAAKARHFEAEIDRRHRRTPYGYVESVTLRDPDDLSSFTQHDSDNDGLWTSMYGAGECFAWAATGDPVAKRRAKAAFEALRFLGEVTQGGTPAPPPGFVARTILPASGPDPSQGDSPERDM
jgi:hypothetical protein